MFHSRISPLLVTFLSHLAVCDAGICILDDSWVGRAKTELNMTALRQPTGKSLPRGPYEVKTGKINRIPGLKKGGPHAGVVVYAVPKRSGEKFPFVSFAHGTTAGGWRTLIDYAGDLEVVASYGFVIVAPESCPLLECFAGYCVDQMETIRACAKDTSLHPALASADFSNVGVYGHSMGAMATVGTAGGSRSCKYDPTLNVKAAVAQHACWDPSMSGANINIPIMFTAGSHDLTCADGCSKRFYKEVKNSPSKVLFDVRGASHYEPTGLGSNSEVPAVAKFLSCWLRNENCDEVYGSSSKEICNQIAAGASLSECTVEGGREAEHVVV